MRVGSLSPQELRCAGCWPEVPKLGLSWSWLLEMPASGLPSGHRGRALPFLVGRADRREVLWERYWWKLRPLAPQGCLEHPGPLTLAMCQRRAGEAGWLLRMGGWWWSSVERGVLVIFCKPKLNLSWWGSVWPRFSLGAAAGGILICVQVSPSFQGRLGSWASPWSWRRWGHSLHMWILGSLGPCRTPAGFYNDTQRLWKNSPVYSLLPLVFSFLNFYILSIAMIPVL